MIKFAVLLAIVVTNEINACGDFYWRDYNGTVPRDAISAGYNKKGEKFYIGHAYLHWFGILMGTITPGSTEITIPCYGVKKASTRVQILCAKKHSRFYWLNLHNEEFARQTEGRCPVVGGYDVHAAEGLKFSLGTCHVGRILKDDQVIIGNIASYRMEWGENPSLFYPYQGQELYSSEFDVLMYTDSPLAIYNGVKNINELDLIAVKD